SRRRRSRRLAGQLPPVGLAWRAARARRRRALSDHLRDAQRAVGLLVVERLAGRFPRRPARRRHLELVGAVLGPRRREVVRHAAGLDPGLRLCLPAPLRRRARRLARGSPARARRPDDLGPILLGAGHVPPIQKMIITAPQSITVTLEGRPKET